MKYLSLALVAGAALVASQTTVAQGYGSGSGPSTGDWEFRIGPVFVDSKTVDYQGGSSVKLDSNTGGRIGIAYYMTPQFSLGGDFAYGNSSFNATVVGNSAPGQPPSTTRIENGHADFSTFNFTGTYHLLDGPIRPFGVAGIGWNWVSTNIATGPPVTGCWWDPWFGYICTPYQPTHGASSFTYQLGVGVQFNFNRQFGVDVDYKETWIELHNASGTPGFGSIEAMFIWRFTGY
jgi:opacity protein-like surface antigen